MNAPFSRQSETNGHTAARLSAQLSSAQHITTNIDLFSDRCYFFQLSSRVGLLCCAVDTAAFFHARLCPPSSLTIISLHFHSCSLDTSDSTTAAAVSPRLYIVLRRYINHHTSN